MISQQVHTAFTHIRRSPYQGLSAILIMTLTFFAATIFALVAYMMSATISYFETRPQIIAFLENEAEPSEISALQRELTGDSRIQDGVQFVSHEEAFRIFKDTMDTPLATELVSPEVFPASLEFSVSDLSFAQELIDELQQEPVVERVEFTASLGGQTTLAQVIENLQNITKYLRIGGMTLLSFLSLTAILTLLVIIGMRVSTRREEINVLTLIGATPTFIRLPFLVEGIIYAVTGVVFGFLIAILIFLYLMPTLSSYFGAVPVIPDQASILAMRLGILFAAELALGIFIGFVGAWFAISRYLRVR